MQVLWDSEGEILPGLIFFEKFYESCPICVLPKANR